MATTAQTDPPASGGAAGQGGSADPGTAVQRLLRSRMEERGWSYADVAKRSGLPRSTVHHLATTRIARAPRPSRLEALAAALDLPLATVQAAVAEATGLSYSVVDVEPDTAVIVAGLAELSPEDRRHVAALVESLRGTSGPRSPRPS